MNMFVKLLSSLVAFCLLSVMLLPTVHLVCVRADQGYSVHRITVEPCGLKGVGSTTVTLTTEQYHSLQQYLVLFRGRLNTTTEYEDSVKLYEEALTKLAILHVIPPQSHLNLREVLQPRSRQAPRAEDLNICALVTGSVSGPDNFLPPLYMALEIPMLLILVLLRMAYYHYWKTPFLYAIGSAIAALAIWRLDVDTHSPVSFLNNIDGPTFCWVSSLGLNGFKSWNGFLSTKPHFFSCPIIVGFTGFKILDEAKETHFFIGTCLYVDITIVSPP